MTQANLFGDTFTLSGHQPTPVPPLASFKIPVVKVSLVRETAVTATREHIGGPADVFAIVNQLIGCEDREHLLVLLLNTKNRVIGVNTVSVGDLSSSIVHPREVYKPAILAGAASIILSHNHPSGDPTPSAEDVAVTKRIQQGGELLGIDLLDHIIVGDGTFVSLKERGLY